MPTVRSSHDGTPIALDDAGAGSPAIVFVPGLTGDRSDFASQVDYFKGSHRVVALDLPGHGASGKDRADWSMASFGRDVATVVEELELEEVVLVGHSFGGDVVTEAASLTEARVRGIVLVSSYRALGSQPDEPQIAAWLAPFSEDFAAAMNDLTRRNFGPNADPSMVSAIAARMMSADPKVVLPVLTSKFHHEPALLNQMERLDIPVFAINPDFKPNDHSSFAARNVELAIVPGVGHYTMMEDPTAFNAVLSDILTGLG